MLQGNHEEPVALPLLHGDLLEEPATLPLSTAVALLLHQADAFTARTLPVARQPARLRSRHASPKLGLFDDFMKKLDPEGAAQRGVLEDELGGGDGSDASLQQTREKRNEAMSSVKDGRLPFEMPKIPNPLESKDGSQGGLPFEMPKIPNPLESKDGSQGPGFELPKMPKLPNPFGEKDKEE